MNFKGDVIFDSSKPDGNPRKLLDSGLMMELGWKEFTNLKKWFKKILLIGINQIRSQKELIKNRIFHVCGFNKTII